MFKIKQRFDTSSHKLIELKTHILMIKTIFYHMYNMLPIYFSTILKLLIYVFIFYNKHPLMWFCFIHYLLMCGWDFPSLLQTQHMMSSSNSYHIVVTTLYSATCIPLPECLNMAAPC